MFHAEIRMDATCLGLGTAVFVIVKIATARLVGRCLVLCRTAVIHGGSDMVNIPTNECQDNNNN